MPNKNMNQLPEATSIQLTDIVWKDDSDSTASAKITFGNFQMEIFKSRVSNVDNAIAFILDTSELLTAMGTKLLTLRNQNVDKFQVDAEGNIVKVGTVDSRDVSADGATLDAHVADATIHLTMKIQSTVPSSPQEGWFWLNDSNGMLQIYTVTGWEDVVYRSQLADAASDVLFDAGYF